jgi:hypothetical protein
VVFKEWASFVGALEDGGSRGASATVGTGEASKAVAQLAQKRPATAIPSLQKGQRVVGQSVDLRSKKVSA